MANSAIPTLAIFTDDAIVIMLIILCSVIHTVIYCIDIITLLLVLSPLTQAFETS